MSGALLISQILMFWALPDEQRLGASLLRGHLRDLARVLRNHMHNANLLNRVLEDIGNNRLGDTRGTYSLELPADPASTMKLFIKSMVATDRSNAA